MNGWFDPFCVEEEPPEMDRGDLRSIGEIMDGPIMRATVGDLRALPYHLYLQTPQWRERRQRALLFGARRCAHCKSRHRLEVHHLSYARLGAELDEDLQVLCRSCHAAEHEKQRRRAMAAQPRPHTERVFP